MTRIVAVAAALSCGIVATGATAPPPEEDYVVHCSGCHGPDGEGTPGVTPPLSGLAPLLDSPLGREYLVRVPGVAQASLGDARLAVLLDWVLSEFSGATPEPPYSADEIGALRRHPLRDPGPMRRRALD